MLARQTAFRGATDTLWIRNRDVDLAARDGARAHERLIAEGVHLTRLAELLTYVPNEHLGLYQEVGHLYDSY